MTRAPVLQHVLLHELDALAVAETPLALCERDDVGRLQVDLQVLFQVLLAHHLPRAPRSPGPLHVQPEGRERRELRPCSRCD